MPLEKHLKNLIAQTGPISMAQFMQVALAHPQYGYYKTHEPFGIKGDFITSPEISQMFGELIGIWVADIWQQMGSPEDIQVVEIGPGRGTLMDDLLRATKHVPGFHENISISMVEISSRLREIQNEKIHNSHSRINWFEDVSRLPQKPVIIVANELFDALPVHQYVKQSGKWHEKMLGLNGAGELEFMLSPEVSALDVIPRIFQQKNYSGIQLKTGWPYSLQGANSGHDEIPDGAIIEICQQAIVIIEEICARIKQHGGAALIIDYGYYKPEFKDTVFAISNHKHHNILENIGNSDISAHVDFSLLAAIAGEKNMSVSGAISQGDFLQNMGIELRAEKLAKNGDLQQKKDIYLAKNRLIGNGAMQMGKLFKVLAISAENLVPAGFNKIEK